VVRERRFDNEGGGMVETFEGLGIAPTLAAAAAGQGWESPTGLQRDALPVIRRGNNVVLHASAGAGVTGAWGLGILDRLAALEADDDDDPRALVLAPTAAAATSASALARLAAGTGLRVRALAGGWPRRAVHLVVASPDVAVAAIRDSSLKLESLAALVVDGADQLAALDHWAALETVLEATPGDAQRVLVTGRFNEEIDGLIERHVRRALTIPPRPVDGEDAAETASAGVVVGNVTVTEADKLAALVALLTDGDPNETAVVCRTPERAARLAADLTARGLDASGERDASAGPDAGRLLVLPRMDADRRGTSALVISYDVPFDAESLAELHGRGGVVLATPRQLPHLQRIAARAGSTLKRVRVPGPPLPDVVRVLRDRLRDTARHADLAADLALVEPLLDEVSAPELAAAALHLARAAGAGTEGAIGTEGRGSLTDAAAVESPRTAATRGLAAPSAPPPTTQWVRLFVSAGSRDGLGPGDLVGAITGEAGLPGDQVGKIEVRESHSTVEVPGELAAAVIQALNGRSLRGRSLRVDYDRKDRTQRRPPGGRGGPRGSTPRGPRPGPRGSDGPGRGRPPR
jgi:ATP-dependent RNA helicase DeaD